MIAVAGFHTEDVVLVVVIVVLLAASGMLALAETSLVRMNRIKAKAMVDEKRRGARQLARLIEHPAKFLNPILLLVLICQLVSATLVGVVAEHLLGGIGVLVGAAFEVIVIFVFFEAVPKNWAVHNPERAALFSAPIVSVVVRFPPDPLPLLPPDRAGQPDHRAVRARATTASGRRTSPTPSSRPWPTWPTRRT